MIVAMRLLSVPGHKGGEPCTTAVSPRCPVFKIEEVGG